MSNMECNMQETSDRLVGKIALVTGASSGIGASICRALVQRGLTVIGVARNIKAIEELKSELKGASGCLEAQCCDVTIDEDVKTLFDDVRERFGGIDICVNNAGMSTAKSLLDGTPEDWRAMLDLNVVALCHCTKLAVASMLERNVDDGHVINVSSVSAHISKTSTPIHFYAATKHAVKAITESVRQELRELKSHIRVSSISPGVVETDFLRRLLNSEEESKKFLSLKVNLSTDDVTRSILHILTAPSHVEINDVIIRSVEQEA